MSLDKNFGTYTPGTGIVNIPTDNLYDKQAAISELDEIKGNTVKSTTIDDISKKTTEEVAIENDAQIKSDGVIPGFDFTNPNGWRNKDTWFTIGLIALSAVIVWFIWFKK